MNTLPNEIIDKIYQYVDHDKEVWQEKMIKIHNQLQGRMDGYSILLDGEHFNKRAAQSFRNSEKTVSCPIY
jgi:hypothetical protein